MKYNRVRSALLAAAIFPAINHQTANAVTDYFWNATAGGTGNWDTLATNWSLSGSTPATLTWPNTGNERANFTVGTAGTVTIAPGGVTAFGINFGVANYIVAGGPLTLAGTGGPIFNNGNVVATISAPIGGTVGLTKSGTATLTLTGTNTYSGGTSVGSSTLVGVANTTGSPFSSGAIGLTFASLRLNGIGANTTTTVGDFTVAAPSGANMGVSNLVIDNTTGSSGGFNTTFAAGNLVRGGTGSVLALTPVTGNLGTTEKATFTNTNGGVTLVNGILPAWVVAQVSGSNLAVDFTTYGGNGVAVATYSSTDLTTSTNTSIVNQASSPTITGDVSAYALKTNQTVDLGGHTLNLGSNTGQSGLILNSGGQVTDGNVNFGTDEGMIYVQGNGTIGTNTNNTIASKNLTISASGAANLTINSSIVDNGSPTQVYITGATSGTSLTLNGSSNYTGGTVMSVNTGSGQNIVLGNDSAFGIGKVTNILAPGANSPQIQASAPRTLANAFDLNGGLNFTGTNPITFTGPINIINAAGATRTLNSTSSAALTVTFGASPGSNTMTIANTQASVIFSPGSANTKFVVNDVIQDPAGGSGGVQFSGAAGGITLLAASSTYTGATQLNGTSTVQFTSDSNAGGTAGPFGANSAVLTPNNGTNNILQPLGGGTRVVGNTVSMQTGFTVANATSDTTNLTLTGPITLTSTTGRTIANNLSTGVTLSLGSASTPSTLTLSNTAAATLTISTSSGATTILTPNLVINDVIKDGSASGGLSITGQGSITLGAQNTYTAGTSLTGQNTTVLLPVSSNALPGSGFTSGPFGTGVLTVNNSSANQHLRPVGGNQLISNPITMSSGFMQDDALGDSWSLTFAGAITEGGAASSGKIISNGTIAANNTTGGNGPGTMLLGSPTTPSTITLVGSGTLAFAAISGPIIINDVIKDPASGVGSVLLNPNKEDVSTIQINSQSTFTGGVGIGAASGGTAGSGSILINVDATGTPGAVTAGPFGRGTLFGQNSGIPGTLVAFNADRTIPNNVDLTNAGFWVASDAAKHNLNMTGTISLTGATGRVITNNMVPTSALTLGSPSAPTALALSAGLTFQTQSTTGGGLTVINDPIIDNGTAGSITVQSKAIVQLKGTNTYTGGTKVLNAGSLSTTTNFNNGALTLTSASFATVLAQATPGMTVGVTSIPSLTILDPVTNAITSKLDLTNNGLIVASTTTSFATIQQAIISARKTDNSWTGPGITSSLATAVAANSSDAHKTAIGYATSTELGSTGTFLGFSYTGTPTLARYTVDGDTDLSGSIDSSDFANLAAHFGSTAGTDWFQGDFNGDGIVNALDFNAIASNYGTKISTLPSSSEPLAMPAASLGALVPEPTVGALLVAPLLIGRRRRRMVLASK